MRARGQPAVDSGRGGHGGPGGRRRVLRGRVLRYTAGSVVAAVCSEAAFLLLYGVFQAAPAVAATIGWLAGAVPNYWLNRSWAWGRRGRPSLTGEVLPYVAIVLGTLVVAALSTTAVHNALAGADVSGGQQTALVGGTFLAVYGLIFLLRFFLLDQLFRPAPAGPPRRGADATSTKENG